jgi:DNA-binding MarR family transcriptional regulator
MSMGQGREEYSLQIVGEDKSPDGWIAESLNALELSSLCEWDVLLFLSRHHATLGNVAQIAGLLNYPSQAVSDALERLDSKKLIRRSRSSLDVRFYQLAASEDQAESSFWQLLNLGKSREGRLLVVKHLQRRAFVGG